MDKAIKAQFDKQLSQVLANLAIYEKSKAFKKSGLIDKIHADTPLKA